jgi:hypothetical protein
VRRRALDDADDPFDAHGATANISSIGLSHPHGLL